MWFRKLNHRNERENRFRPWREANVGHSKSACACIKAASEKRQRALFNFSCKNKHYWHWHIICSHNPFALQTIYVMSATIKAIYISSVGWKKNSWHERMSKLCNGTKMQLNKILTICFAITSHFKAHNQRSVNKELSRKRKPRKVAIAAKGNWKTNNQLWRHEYREIVQSILGGRSVIKDFDLNQDNNYWVTGTFYQSSTVRSTKITASFLLLS